ncbi:MAG: T9SS type A sorting domain-containing protein [Candidatus Kapaibacterium sp.]
MKTIFFLLSTICVLAQQPHIITPNGNEKYKEGDTITIRWDGVGPNVPVRLEYSVDNGNSWFLIKEEVIGNEYKWIPYNEDALIHLYLFNYYNPIRKNIFKVRAVKYGTSLNDRVSVARQLGCGTIPFGTWSSDEKYFACTTNNGFEIWDVQKQDKISWFSRFNPKHKVQMSCQFSLVPIAFINNDKRILITEENWSILYEYDIATNSLIENNIVKQIHPRSKVIVSTKGNYIAYQNRIDQDSIQFKVIDLRNFSVKTVVSVYQPDVNSNKLNLVFWINDTTAVIRLGSYGGTSFDEYIYNVITNTVTSNSVTSVNGMDYRENFPLVRTISDKIQYNCVSDSSGLFVEDVYTNKRVNLPSSSLYRYNIAWQPSSYVIAYQSKDSTQTTLQIFDVSLNKIDKSITLSNHFSEVTSIKWSHSGKYLTVSTSDGYEWILNIDNSDVVFKKPSLPLANSISWSFEGKYLAIATYNTIEVWDTDNNNQIVVTHIKTDPNQNLSEQRVCWSVDGNMILFIANQDSVYLWDWRQNKILDKLFIPNANLIATNATTEYAIIVADSIVKYDYKNHKILNKLPYYTGWNSNIVVSKDGKLWYLNNYDTTLVLDSKDDIIDSLPIVGIHKIPSPTEPKMFACRYTKHGFFGYPDPIRINGVLTTVTNSSFQDDQKIIDYQLNMFGNILTPAWNETGNQVAFPSKFNGHIDFFSSEWCFVSGIQITNVNDGVCLGYFTLLSNASLIQHHSPLYRPNSNEIAIGGEVAIGKIQPVEYTLDESDSAFTIQMESDTTTEVNESIPPTCTLYPNPTSGELYVQGVSGTIEMYSLLGELVFLDSTSTTSERRIPTEHLPSGMYRVVCTQGKHRLSKAVVVQH